MTDLQRYTAEFRSAVDARLASFDLRPLVQQLSEPRLINPPVNGHQWQVVFYLPRMEVRANRLDLALSVIHRFGGTTEHLQTID